MGLKKILLYFGGLAVAVGVPFGFFSVSDVASGVRKAWSAAVASTAGTATQTSPSVEPNAGPLASIPSSASATVGSNASATANIPTLPLDEVMRFDLTVEWVLQHWPRVSTGLTYLQLQGYRVPLVTGGNLTDLAGSLTYYFNARQQVERITLRGTTGDPSELARLVTSRYRFTRRLTNDPGLVLYEAVNSSNQLAGSLRIRSAQVVKSAQPYTRFEVDLTMDRPE
jgi:hypothetical protein